jgi:hypothetical protein
LGGKNEEVLWMESCSGRNIIGYDESLWIKLWMEEDIRLLKHWGRRKEE